MRDRDREREDSNRGSIEDKVETALTELAVMQKVLEMLNKSLFGGDGVPGIISVYGQRIAKLEKSLYIALGIYMAVQFLTGSGMVTLKTVMGK